MPVAIGTWLLGVGAVWTTRRPLDPGIAVQAEGSPVAQPGARFVLRVTTPAMRTEPQLMDAYMAPRALGPFVFPLAYQRRVLDVPMRVMPQEPMARPGATPLPKAQPPGDGLGVEILPAGGGLVSGLDTTVWIRVTDPGGRPAPGAAVSYTASGATPPTGEVETDIAGLASIELRATSPGPRLKVEAARGAERGSASEALTPTAHSCVVSVDRMLQTPGEPPLRVTVSRSGASEPLYCSLWLGDAWVRVWHRPAAPEPLVRFDVDLSEDGLYRFVCSARDLADETQYGIYLLRRSSARHRAMAGLLRDLDGDSRTAVWRRAAPAIDEAAENALFTTYATQPVPPVRVVVLATTADEDAAAAHAADVRARGRLFAFAGAGAALVLLWVALLAIHGAICAREVLAATIPGMAVPASLIRLRLALGMGFGLGLAAALVLVLLEWT